MGNHATVEYCDCRHFSIIKQKCQNCQKIVCSSCFGYPIINQNHTVQNPQRINLIKVCKICYTTLNRVDTAEPYEIMGAENSTCLLMIHSQGLSRGMYKKYALGFQQKGFKCILIDLPAHGSLIQEQFTYLNYCRSVKRVIEKQIGTHYFYVVACSLPALAFLQFMSENQVKCKRAVLLSTGSCFKKSAGNKMQELICPNGQQFIKLQSPSDKIKTTVFRSTLQGGFYPISTKSYLQFQKKFKFPQSISQLKGNLKVLFINGQYQDRRKQTEYHQALSPSSTLYTYLKVGAFFWCNRVEYYKLFNDLSRFFEQS